MDEPACPGCRLLLARLAELEARIQRLEAENAALRQALDEARRAGKRQAAPFRKAGGPKPDAKKPGRKPGEDYGTQARRDVPAPETITEVLDAPLPDACPDCGGGVKPTHVAQQYQIELPSQPIVRQFDIHVGHCRDCQRRVQGRHPLQTSDALGAAAVQLGPRAQAFIAWLNKELGLSHGKVVRCLKQLCGVKLSRSGAVRIMLRVGRKCAPTYQVIRRAVRDSPWVVPDETGWRVSGHGAWLHTHVGRDATCYVVDPTRGGQVLADVIGWNYAGVLIHDGWSPYDGFTRAGHQQCLAHLVRRCEERLLTATRGAVRFPRALLAWCGDALRLRDRHAAGKVSAPNLAQATRRLQRQLERLVAPTKQDAANERLAAFLWRHRHALLTFLRRPGIDATNWRAEQATRPAVVNRKVWGGNRTWIGAQAQAILMSVFRTCWQRGHDALAFVQHLLCAPQRLALLPEG